MGRPAAVDVREAVARPAGTALDVLAGGEILSAAAAARALRPVAATDGRVSAALVELLDGGDHLAAMLALDALAWVRSPRVESAFVEALSEPDLGEHAAWALAAGRKPVLSAIPALVHLVAVGGFPAMPAQLTLERWSSRAGERVPVAIGVGLARSSSEDGWSRLAETLDVVKSRRALPVPVRGSRRDARRRAHQGSEGRGQRIAQVLLRGRVDVDLAHAGSSDGGGVVTLLVQLARELGLLEGVERSTILARPSVERRAEHEALGSGASIVRLPFGPVEDVPVGDMWEHRVQIERALAASLAAEPVDVAHLRYADAGTFAAAQALRRAGVATVFTAAPDPHALIADAERMGRLSRRSFADAERREHNLFRLRLVDELMRDADRVITLPRAGGDAELERLLGRPLEQRRTVSIPEGISITESSEPDDGASPLAAELASLIASRGSTRAGLPLIVSVGRMHPIKGFPRLVEAWAGDPRLYSRFNLVLAGGDLERPTAQEHDVLDEIEWALRRHPAARPGLVLLGARPHDDVGRLLSIARHGLAGRVAPGGVYACASAKEEFGVSILEALAQGLAVVAPDAGGPAAYLEDGVTGVLVDPGRVDTLRAGLHRAARVARDEGRAHRAASLVRERFAVGPMASALAATYRSAVDEANR